LDGSGNVFVAGYTTGPLDGDFAGGRALQDVVMVKLDPSGQQLWLRQVGGLSNDYARSVVVDAQGNSYAIGDTPGGVTDTSDTTKRGQFLVIKFDPDGTELWRKELGDKAINGKHGDDFAKSAGLDANGFLYVGGYTTSSAFDPAVPVEAFIAKMNPSGDVLWTRRFKDPNGTGIEDLVVNATGDVLVGGNTLDSPGGLGAGFVAKYDTAGSRLWFTQTSRADLAIVLALNFDGAGHSFMTGTAGDAFDGKTGQDVFVQELDINGVRH
jgi:hypothetical protein